MTHNSPPKTPKMIYKMFLFCFMFIFLIASVVPVHAGILFDENDDLVNLGAEASLAGLSVLTICAWIKPSCATSSYKTLFSNYNASIDGWDIYVKCNGAGGQLGLGTSWGNSAPYAYYEKTFSVMTSGAWHHVCAVQNGNSHTNAKLYVDGVEIVASDVASNGSRDSDAGTTFYIGNDYTGGAGFPGTIADIRLYNRVLSLAEVQLLYNSKLKGVGVLASGLIGYWPLDDGEAGTSADGDAVREFIGGYDGSGDNGANNTGLTWQGETFIRKPSTID